MNCRLHIPIQNAICIVCVFLLIFIMPALGINVQCSSSDGTNSVSFNAEENLALPSSSHMDISLGPGSLQASGDMFLSGDNSVRQSASGSSSSAGSGGSYSVSSSISNSGLLSASTSAKVTGSSVGQSQSISGVGSSSISQAVTGNGNTANSITVSNGQMMASTTSLAFPGAAGLSQQVDGIGDITLDIGGANGQDMLDQYASVSQGAIASSQSISANQGLSSEQGTEMAGLTGRVTSSALSDKNVITANGNFVGSGSISAALSASTSSAKNDGGSSDTGSGSISSASGDITLDGIKLLDSSTTSAISKSDENNGMSLDLLKLVDDQGHIGSIGTSAASMDRDTYDRTAVQSQTDQQSSTSSIVSNGGSATSYILEGFRWNANNPMIQLYLNPAGSPVDQNLAKNAIIGATQTWESAVAQNLFADGNTVVIDSSKTIDPNINDAGSANDHYNVIGWRPFSELPSSQQTNTLAYTRTYYGGPQVSYNGGSYWSASQSDMAINSLASWSASTTPPSRTTPVDVQSVVTHELGHTLGLGDLYLSSVPNPAHSDFAQIMNAYNDPQRILGNGDIAGIQLLYGQPTSNQGAGSIPIYRMWSPAQTDHFYTTNYNEYSTTAVNYGYQQEGILGYLYSSPQTGTTPIYRMWSPAQMDHFYTTSYSEYSTTAVNYGYQQEGILGYLYSSSQTGATPIYRMYSPSQTDHFYTTNYNEYGTTAVNNGYRQEGILGYGSG